MIDLTAWAPPRMANIGDYGVGRRPTRADRTPVDAAALAEWQARQDKARDEYLERPSHAEVVARMRGWL